jgi:hypothetical protein
MTMDRALNDPAADTGELQAGTPCWAASGDGKVSLIPASEMEAHWASARPGCPRELPTADEVRAWLDEDPEVGDPVFLAEPDTPRDDFLAYPAQQVPAIILAALRRWGCDPQFSAEEVALSAAPWSLLEPLPRPDFRALCASLLQGLDENRHEQVRYPGHLRLVMADARAALGQSSPAPTRDELNELVGPSPTVEEVALNAAPWPLLEPPPAPTRDELNDASGPGPTVEPAFTPIPVSERLPGPEDCAPWPGEPERGPWCWCAKYIGGGWKYIGGGWKDIGGGWRWLQIPAPLDDCKSAIFRAIGCTHWAPWWALPIPTTQENSDNG